jgi:DNA (cytosine-5)-methyltransferase 1
MRPLRFVDLFAGIGGFHIALRALGHECVFASEIDDELRELYLSNFPEAHGVVYGDIRDSKEKVPAHDILCAGFPCQPFSKSGTQEGMRDKTRGTLFNDILDILTRHRPHYLILENVGNFERHDGGLTWKIVQASLVELGYDVRGTVHVASGGHGLISPHHLGYPHTRERFFIVASLSSLPTDPFPPADRTRKVRLRDVVQSKSELSRRERKETAITEHRIRCIDHWNKLLRRIPDSIPLPSFPIWGDEIGARYPFKDKTPWASDALELWDCLRGMNASLYASKRELLELLPSYARTPEKQFPDWKIEFIRQNRAWFRQIARYLSPRWVEQLRTFPPSLRKLEWNCQGEERDLWKCVLQFRPSGLRAKRYTSCPALVAMTTTQIPILGPKRRFITRVEGLRLQGFPDEHALPKWRDRAFMALGNAVHAEVAKAIAERLLAGRSEGRPPARASRPRQPAGREKRS